MKPTLNKCELNKKRHFILTNVILNKEELQQLDLLLYSFPHANKSKTWPDKFAKLNVEKIPEKLLLLAANAFDSYGNTMLGVAAEYGKSIESVQRLIDMGADLEAQDLNGKLALHWAIGNALSYNDKTSYIAADVVQCLLDNGAKTDITVYQGITPLEYARNRGYLAAADLIEKNNNKVRSLSQLCFFKLRDMVKNKDITKDDLKEALPKDALLPRCLANLIK